MSRVPALSVEELPGDLQEAVGRAEALMGFVSNDTLTMARNPTLLRAFADLVGAVYTSGQIDSGLKRMLGLVTSSAAGCTYCVGHTAFASERQGVAAEKLRAIWDFERSDLFSAAERCALRVALHAGQSPNAVTDEQFAGLSEYFDADAQLEIVSVIALFGFLNRWNSTLATELEALPRAALDDVGQEAMNG